MRSQDIYKCDLPIEVRAAIRKNLSECVALTTDCIEYHVTTYAAMDALIVRLFIETGATAIYVDGECIAVNYGRARGFEPTARSLYAKKMAGRGCEPAHVSALSGLTVKEVQQFNRRPHRKGE